MPSFAEALKANNIRLDRSGLETIQVNLGLLCNQACKHCHLEAGPARTEIMSAETAGEVVALAARIKFHTADLTGGAPELNPNLPFLVEGLRPLVERFMVRANLTALGDGGHDHLYGLFAENKVAVVASLAAPSPAQTDAQRGKGTFEKAMATLQKLNRLGYGQPESGLTLDLVSNPAGAFLPPDQVQAEKRFRTLLADRHGVVFNNLYTFANVPLGRFGAWLKNSGNFDSYLEKLTGAFNPCAVEGLMCRSQISVNWDGYLFDCDFNLAAGLPLGGRKTHISQLAAAPEPGSPIAVGDHCFTCTAGAGFT